MYQSNGMVIQSSCALSWHNLVVCCVVGKHADAAARAVEWSETFAESAGSARFYATLFNTTNADVIALAHAAIAPSVKSDVAGGYEHRECGTNETRMGVVILARAFA